MRKHVDEVNNGNVQRRLERVELTNDLLAEVRLVDLVVGIGITSAETLNHRANEFFFVLVLRIFVTFLNPVFGILLLDLQRHQACKNSVARILRSGRQDGGIQLLVFDREELRQQRLDDLPL